MVKYDCEVLLKLRNNNARSILDGIEKGCMRNAGEARPGEMPTCWRACYVRTEPWVWNSRIYILPQCWGARESRVPGTCHPQSLVNQWASLVTNPGTKVKVDRGGGRYSVEISNLDEHRHVHMPHTEVDTYKLSKMYRDMWQFSKYKKYYTEQEISYLSQITFFHFLLNLLECSSWVS